MTLLRTSHPLFNNLLDDLFNAETGNWKRREHSPVQATLPKVNIKEHDEGYAIEMAVPRRQKEDFTINLDQNVLTISAVKGKDKHDKGIEYRRKEFGNGAFRRSFTLPESINGEKIAGTYNDGILSVSIPKKDEAKPQPVKTIKVA